MSTEANESATQIDPQALVSVIEALAKAGARHFSWGNMSIDFVEKPATQELHIDMAEHMKEQNNESEYEKLMRTRKEYLEAQDDDLVITDPEAWLAKETSGGN